MDFQHKLAESLAASLEENMESKEEQALLVYGIELFLNEFLKIVLILGIAAMAGELKLAIFYTSYLLIARKCSGGKHFGSNIICMLFTFLTAYIIPMAGTMVTLPLWLQVSMGLIETGLIFIYVPYIKKGKEITKEQKRKRKIAMLIVFLGYLGAAWLFNADTFVNGILFIEMIVVLAAVKS